MAFVPVLLRRAASSSALPAGIRVFGCPRTFHSAASTILSSEKQSLPGQGLNGAGSGLSPLFLRFSTAAVEEPTVDETLIRTLESGVDAAGSPKVEGVPDGCPFDIVQDNPGNLTVILQRRFGREVVRIKIDLSQIVDIGEANIPSSIPLSLNIIKPNRQEGLGFAITAFPREFTIDTLAISDDNSSCGGLHFSDLDSEMQKAFHKYVEARGLEPITINFLFQFVANKVKRDWLNCLHRVKKFVED
ncbi:unnamed protein product [Linum trigynum]|uniref:Mitochondrial glycoprotein n=1 Tax=Linum trigynum TaxID=586398 RepID=A0AAV2DZY3_9ROSI